MTINLLELKTISWLTFWAIILVVIPKGDCKEDRGNASSLKAAIDSKLTELSRI